MSPWSPCSTKTMPDMLMLFTISKIAVDSFLAGATAAISLYCGTKTPLARRRK